MEVQKSKRYRVNVTSTTKGQKTWDCTVEIENGTMSETLIESDKLVGALEARYPAPVVTELVNKEK